VVAAGDVARWWHAGWKQNVRIEHWQNAQDMAEHAARTLLAELRGANPRAYTPAPWFWSDQFDCRISLAGRRTPGAVTTVVQGSLAERRFVATYVEDGVVTGAVGMNMPLQIIEWQRRLATRQTASGEACEGH
jgi:NADPH-dependent 2,4-dienoyl-CoA reductase/sulfur reductase-like enzyme